MLQVKVLSYFNISKVPSFSKLYMKLNVLGFRRSSDFKYDYYQKISLDDLRLKKHLKILSDEFLQLQNNIKNGGKLTATDQQAIFKLKPLIAVLQKLEEAQNELGELHSFIAELSKHEDELESTALNEKEKLINKLEEWKFQLLDYLIPDDTIDDKDIIMELQAGVGGQEAMLFTKSMCELYSNYFSWKRWNCELLKIDSTELGGVRNAHFIVSGPKAYKHLKFESGVHRVQRIPKTEKSGRMHTSTMTVAVLPQPSEIDIVLNKKDLEFVFKRSSAPGGQNVNKTDSCARVTHLPTGIFSECQIERDQHKNKEMALKFLRAKLYEKELESITNEAQLNRKLQVGSAGRSEKVRTYNYAQDRITDHRAQISIFDVETFFLGREMLDQLIERLHAWNCSQILMNILNKHN